MISIRDITNFQGLFEDVFITDECDILWPNKGGSTLSINAVPNSYFVKKSKVKLRIKTKATPGARTNQPSFIDGESEITARFKNDEEYIDDFVVIRTKTNGKVVDFKVRVLNEAATNSKVFIKATLIKLNSPVKVESEHG